MVLSTTCLTTLDDLPILGWRRDGRPIRLIAGGAPDDGDDTDGGTEDDATSPDDTDGGSDGAQKALAAERKARRAAEKALKDAAAKLQAADDKDKSETERLQNSVTVAEKRADDAEQRLLRLEVGAEKGLSYAQARRLVGATREELETDAGELLEAFGAGGSKDDKEPEKKPATSRKPVEKLRPGAAPDAEEKVDSGKLAASILERPF